MKQNLRKVLMLLALLTLCVALCISFASCKKKVEEHTHEWGEGKVTTEATCTTEGVMTYTCSCNETKTEPIAKKEHTYTEVRVEPTCTEAGTVLHTCTCGHSYSDPIPALGHSYTTTEHAATCSSYGYTLSECKNCDAEYKKLTTILDHNYVLDTEHSVAATCAHDGSNVYVCQNEGCQYSYSETVKATAHKYVLDPTQTQEVSCLVHGQNTYVCQGCDSSYTVVTQAAKGKHTAGEWTASEPVLVEGCNYKIVETTKCVDCQEDMSREKIIQKHNHQVVVTEPTCTTPGSLVYTCACGDTYSKEYAVNPNAHVWGEPVEGVYTCTECGATKKELVVENGEVSKDNVTADTELKLDNNTTMQMDETLLEQLPENVQLGADVVDKSTLPDNVDKERIGDNPVYDFTLTADGGNVNFNGGKMTVRVPYTLEPGEDPNNIVVWYIDDDGNVDTIPATYVNGEAVFEVEHFSKYAVVRMTAEELCAKLGCEKYTIEYPVTCTDDGYTIEVCKRCHKTTTVATVESEGHNYQKTTVPATCTAGGYDSYSCSVCGDSYKQNYVNAKGHSYVDTVVSATCSTKGYTLHTCSACNSAYKDSYTDATGHNFNEGACVKCGAIDNGYVEAKDNFYFTLIESLLGLDNLYVNLSDVEIVVKGYDVIGGNSTLADSATVKLELLHFMLTVDENGNPVGKGEGRLTGTSDSEVFFGEYNTISANAVVVLKDNGLYVFAEANADNIKERMELFYDITKTPAMDSFNEIAEIIPALEMLYSEGLDDIIAGIKELRGNPINGIIAAIMEYVYVKEETATGYVFTLNYDRLPEIYDVVMNKNLAEIFDLVFGEDALLNTTSWIKSTWTKDFATVEEELSDLCASIGVDLKEVYAYINKVVEMTMTSPDDQDDPDYKAFDVEDLLDELREVKVCDYVNGMLGEGAEQITAEQFAEMVDQVVNQFGTLKVVDIIGMINNSRPQPDSPNYDGSVDVPQDGYDGNNSGPKYSDDTESADPMRAQIVELAKMLKGLSISFTTDKDGAFVSFNINVDLEDLLVGGSMSENGDRYETKLTASGALVVNTTGKVDSDFNEVVNAINNKIGKLDFEAGDEINVKYPAEYHRDEYVVLEHNGKLYMAVKFDIESIKYAYLPDIMENYEETELDGVPCIKFTVRLYDGVVSLDNLGGYMMYNNCNGYVTYSVASFADNYAETYYDVYMVNAEEVLKAEINTELTFTEKNLRDSTQSFEIVYSTAENKFYAYSDMHNFVLVSDKKPVCCDEGIRTYQCTVCGRTTYEHYQGRDTIDKVVTLLTPGTTCEEGVRVEEKCNVCGKVFHSYTTTSHEMCDIKIYIENGCGETYILINSCACGYFSNTNSWDGSDFIHGDCIINKVEGYYESEGKYDEEDLPVYEDGRYNVYRALYRCAVETCNVEYSFEKYTIRDAENCVARTYYNYTVNGTPYNFVHTEDSHVYGNEVKVEDVQILGYTVPHMRATCSACGEVVNDYLYLSDKYGRTLVNYSYLEGYGNAYVIYSDCTYTSYRIDENLNCIPNDNKGDDYDNPDRAYMHANSWWNYNHIEGSCTQVGRDERYCEACHLTETYASGYPEGHNYTFNGEVYVCERCGVESNKGVDGNFIMENFSDNYYDAYDMINWGYIAAGFYNKSCHRAVNVYVILNYATDTETWLDGVDYERHYVNEGFNDKYYEYNNVYGKVVIDNESLRAAVENSGVTDITSISIVFSYYDANDTYLNEILTVYEAPVSNE